MWAIHTTLYRVCCIEYTWLFVNAQFYGVLCISHYKCEHVKKICLSVSDFYMKIINNNHTLNTMIQ